MENKVIDNKTRRYCLYIGLLACLVAVTAMAGHVAAAGWYLADRDGTQEGDLSGTFNSALDDQKILRYYGDFQYGIVLGFGYYLIKVALMERDGWV